MLPAEKDGSSKQSLKGRCTCIQPAQDHAEQPVPEQGVRVLGYLIDGDHLPDIAVLEASHIVVAPAAGRVAAKGAPSNAWVGPAKTAWWSGLHYRGLCWPVAGNGLFWGFGVLRCSCTCGLGAAASAPATLGGRHRHSDGMCQRRPASSIKHQASSISIQAWQRCSPCSPYSQCTPFSKQSAASPVGRAQSSPKPLKPTIFEQSPPSHHSHRGRPGLEVQDVDLQNIPGSSITHVDGPCHSPCPGQLEARTDTLSGLLRCCMQCLL